MINYFIAVFAAGLALYGSLLADYTLASALVSIFMGVVSVIFYLIDRRNKFDVKQSQWVISQYEQDCGFSEPAYENGRAAGFALGVFHNEDDVFKYYDLEFRRTNEEYKALLKTHKALRRLKKRKNAKKWEQELVRLEKERARLLECCAAKDPSVSKKAIEDSLKERFIPHLSTSIRWMYWVCMGASAVTFLVALAILFI